MSHLDYCNSSLPSVLVLLKYSLNRISRSSHARKQIKPESSLLNTLQWDGSPSTPVSEPRSFQSSVKPYVTQLPPRPPCLQLHLLSFLLLLSLFQLELHGVSFPFHGTVDILPPEGICICCSLCLGGSIPKGPYGLLLSFLHSFTHKAL